MKDSEGTFQAPDQKRYRCPKCGQNTMKCEVWLSHCGGYEDYRYTCTAQNCGYVLWVDGPDA